MMRIHKEGWTTIVPVGVLLFILNATLFYFCVPLWIVIPFFIVTIGFYGIVISFFRNPKRIIPVKNNKFIYAPADGKVVVIEKTHEEEYFKDERIQVSIFMSPLNVHVNRFPISGIITFYKYHPGKNLVAWHPKSSSLNERTSIVLKTEKGTEILIRQIAGAVARRVVCYAAEGLSADQGEDLGFIKFGSRVDLFLPLSTKINAHIDQIVKGNVTVLAEI